MKHVVSRCKDKPIFIHVFAVKQGEGFPSRMNKKYRMNWNQVEHFSVIILNNFEPIGAIYLIYVITLQCFYFLDGI